MIVAILTGRRPRLLDETLASLEENCPHLVKQSKQIIFNNSGDQPTKDVIADYTFDMIYESTRTLPIGEAISFLGKQIQTFYSKEEYVLFLEDDWLCDLHEDEWVYPSLNMISKRHISQVRLRHSDEKVLDNHMVTGKPIRWAEYDEGFSIAESAHLTFNPSLLKIRDLKKFLPADGERHAQKNWVVNNMGAVVQHMPGVFRHIGGHNSLRAITGCQA